MKEGVTVEPRDEEVARERARDGRERDEREFRERDERERDELEKALLMRGDSVRMVLEEMHRPPSASLRKAASETS